MKSVANINSAFYQSRIGTRRAVQKFSASSYVERILNLAWWRKSLVIFASIRQESSKYFERICLRPVLATTILIFFYCLSIMTWIQSLLTRCDRLAHTNISPTPPHELERLVRMYGQSALAHSFLVNPEFMTFHVPELGSVVYFTSSNYSRAIIGVVGEPLAEKEHWSSLLDFFQRQFPHAVFYYVSEDFAVLLGKRGYYINGFGTEPDIDISAYVAQKPSTNLRKAMQRARNGGCQVRELSAEKLSPAVRSRLAHISDEWRATKLGGHREMRVFIRYFDAREEQLCSDAARLFVVERPTVGEGPLIEAFMIIDPMYKNGQIAGYVPAVIRQSCNAHPESLKVLQHDILQKLQVEGHKSFNLGVAPFFNIGKIIHRNAFWVYILGQFFFHFGNKVYAFKDLAFAKARYGGGLHNGSFRNPAVSAKRVYIAHRYTLPLNGLVDLYVMGRFVGFCGTVTELWRKMI